MAGKKDRKGNGEGSIRKRASDGRWEARLSLPGGRSKSFYGRTRQDVAAKLTAAKRDLDLGLPVVNDQQTVGQFLAWWLETIQPNMKLRGWQRYESEVRLHLVPTLGSLRLAKLAAGHLERLYGALLDEGYAPASVGNIHAVIHRALNKAERLGLVPRNVASLVQAPRPASPEMRPLTIEQAHALLDAARGDRLEALYVLAITTGMRLGELLALTWADVNLDTGAVQVRHTLTRTGAATWQLDTPKTPKSRRRIQLPPLAAEALQRHQARQQAERDERQALAAGPDHAWHDHDLVFTRPQDGEPLRAQHVLQRQLHPLLERAGLPRIRFHDLRHTAATLLVSEVPLKVASELLGHSSVAITADRYSHVMPSHQQDAADAMQRSLSRTPQKEGKK